MEETSNKSITWNDLFSHWRWFFEDHQFPLKMGFTEIPVSPPMGDQIGKNIVDWWPTAKLAERRDFLTREFAFWGWDRQRKGTLHTAELLYACRDDPEQQAAVLIGASAWDKIQALPASWRGETLKLLKEILVAVCHSPEGPFKQRGREVWHHAMRGTLPVNIVDRDLGECVRIKSYEDFVQLAAIEATLATLAWTPVILNPTP